MTRRGVFGSVAMEHRGHSIVINEHSRHAMSNFCEEVYDAWAKYLDRLKQIECACPSLPPPRDAAD